MTTLEDTTVTYEDLAAIERKFDEADLEMTKKQITILHPLYKIRTETTSQIPNFWPLVLEQAPPDIDQYIQPSDSAILLSSLSSLSVSHFDFDPSNPEGSGDPRSLSITFGFKENPHFSNTTLEKKFWFRRDKKGFSGLVSEPVKIDWNSKDKDLTGGLLTLVCDCWQEEQNAPTPAASKSNGKGKGAQAPKQKLSPKQLSLKKKIENTGMGGMSFFAWFGFIGRRVTAEESAEATKAWEAGEPITVNDEEEDEEDEDLSFALEIFPDGDDLAIAISEDLWPGAIKYFTQAQEQDGLSDADFESDDGGISDLNDQGSGSDDGEKELPAKKKRKA